MKSLILSAAILLSAVSAQAQQVNIQLNFEQPSQLVLKADSMIVIFGQAELARPAVRMTNGTLGIGSRVITSNSYDVKVEGMSPGSNRIMVRYVNNGNSIDAFDLNNLAVTNGCNGVYCVGERVITPNNYIVEVLGFFGDGRIAIRYINNGNSIDVINGNVAIMDACNNQFCTGDYVITASKYKVRIEGIFADGRLAIRYIENGNSLEVISGGSVFLTEAVCANIYVQRVGLCAN